MRHLNTFLLCVVPFAVGCGSTTNGAAQSETYSGQNIAVQYMHIDVPGGISESLSVDNEGNVVSSTQRWCTTGCPALTDQSTNSVNHTLSGDELLQFKQQMVGAGLFKLGQSYQTSNCSIIETMKVQVDGDATEVTVACPGTVPAGVQQALSAVNGVLADF